MKPKYSRRLKRQGTRFLTPILNDRVDAKEPKQISGDLDKLKTLHHRDQTLAPPATTMCYRQLLFKRSAECQHLTKTGETVIDCQSPQCHLSSAHPSTCGTQQHPCSCRRYYGQPVRRVTATTPGRCVQCLQA